MCRRVLTDRRLGAQLRRQRALALREVGAIYQQVCEGALRGDLEGAGREVWWTDRRSSGAGGGSHYRCTRCPLLCSRAHSMLTRPPHMCVDAQAAGVEHPAGAPRRDGRRAMEAAFTALLEKRLAEEEEAAGAAEAGECSSHCIDEPLSE